MFNLTFANIHIQIFYFVMDIKLYERNRIYISDEKQGQIKNFRVFLGGAGLGGNIAEVALRLGFENITIADGDLVSESNIKRKHSIKYRY